MRIIFKSDEDVSLLFEDMNDATRRQILRFLKDRYINKPLLYRDADKVYVTDICWSHIPHPAFYVFAESKTKWAVDGYLKEFKNLNGKPIKIEVEL